jgi:GMP reductase
MDTKLDFSDVLICPQKTNISSRSKVEVVNSYSFLHSPIKWSGVPIIAANMDTTGTFEVYEVLKKHKCITAMNKFYTPDDYKKAHEKFNLDPDYFMVSSGITDQSLQYLQDVFSVISCNWICIDVANGYMNSLIPFCKKVRQLFPSKIIVAGNVVTRDVVKELLLEGKVDIVKVGIGPGSCCTTRIKTGVGMPQLSAIMECAQTANKIGGHIIGDGGITCPGDCSKAFGAGAHFVMMGGAFAGHNENPGNTISKNGILYKSFYGMSSSFAMKKHYGGVKNYRTSEGRHVLVKYKGALENTITDYIGGIRSTCTYINSPSITEMEKNTKFVIVHNQYNKSLL